MANFSSTKFLYSLVVSTWGQVLNALSKHTEYCIEFILGLSASFFSPSKRDGETSVQGNEIWAQGWNYCYVVAIFGGVIQ